MNHQIITFLYSTVLILIYASSATLDRDTLKIMPFINSKSDCIKCHEKKNIKTKIEKTTKACDTLCFKCHSDTDRHHTVGAKLYADKGNNFVLTGKKRIACVTCHNLNEKRFASTSWRAESLFEKVFRNKSKYKTYYLVTNNSNGQLCKKCH